MRFLEQAMSCVGEVMRPVAEAMRSVGVVVLGGMREAMRPVGKSMLLKSEYVENTIGLSSFFVRLGGIEEQSASHQPAINGPSAGQPRQVGERLGRGRISPKSYLLSPISYIL